MRSWIFYLNLIVIIGILLPFFSINDAYTITQYDRQWINALRHTSFSYYNRAWEKKQWDEFLRAYAQDQAQGRKQIESLYDTNDTIHQNSSYISKSRIYHHNYGID